MSETRYGGPSPYSQESITRRKRMKENEMKEMRKDTICWCIKFAIIILAIFGIGYIGGLVAVM